MYCIDKWMLNCFFINWFLCDIVCYLLISDIEKFYLDIYYGVYVLFVGFVCCFYFVKCF